MTDAIDSPIRTRREKLHGLPLDLSGTRSIQLASFSARPLSVLAPSHPTSPFGKTGFHEVGPPDRSNLECAAPWRINIASGSPHLRERTFAEPIPPSLADHALF